MSNELNQTERWLIGELFKLSQEVSALLCGAMGADIEQAGPPSFEEEFQLGPRLAEMGTVMVARAGEHRCDADSVDLDD